MFSGGRIKWKCLTFDGLGSSCGDKDNQNIWCYKQNWKKKSYLLTLYKTDNPSLTHHFYRKLTRENEDSGRRKYANEDSENDAKEATFDMEAAYLMMTAFSGTYLILYLIATVMLTLHQFIRTKVRCVSTVHFGLTIFFSPKKKITWKGLDE